MKEPLGCFLGRGLYICEEMGFGDLILQHRYWNVKAISSCKPDSYIHIVSCHHLGYVRAFVLLLENILLEFNLRGGVYTFRKLRKLWYPVVATTVAR